MRELVQSKPKVIISIVFIAIVLATLGAVKFVQSRSAVAHAQSSHQDTQHVQTAIAQSSTTPQSASEQSAPHTPKSDSSEHTLGATSSQPNPIVPTSNAPVGSQNSASQQMGVVKGQTVYDASGNACGIGPTGICVMPFASRTIEVVDNNGNLVATVVSAMDGRFNLILTPGTYTLVPGPGYGVNPSAKSIEVTVASGTTSEVTIDYWAIAMTNALQL